MGSPAAEEDKPPQANTFQVSVYGTFAIVSLAKGDHIAKFRVSMAEYQSRLRDREGNFAGNFANILPQIVVSK